MKTHMNFLYIVRLITLLTAFLPLSCSDNGTIEEKLQRVLDKGISRYNVRGVSAAAIFPDGSVWTGVSGISHDTVSLKPDMLFAIGSVTKNIVAALTLKLAEDSLLSLDDPLSNWLPKYPHIDGNITIRQLLNHTSGIYMFWENQDIWDDLKKDRAKVWTPEEVLTYIKEPYFAPGEGSRYSNTNYLLLAMIIQKATGSSLSTEIRRHFWQPLKIDNAYLSIEEDIPENQLAHVYGDNFNNDGSYLDLTFLPRASHESITYGSSGIFITAKDLVRWCHALFEGKVLQQQSLDEMQQFIDIDISRQNKGYGLGLELYAKSIASGEKSIGHCGGNIGTTTYMVHLPEHNMSIVVMINAFPNRCAGVITKGLISKILREYKVIGIIPYIAFFPYGSVLISFSIFWTVIIIMRIRKKSRLTINSFIWQV
ncbi:serine hydrolase domain-containing protein [Gemmatimonadota bacterium]